MERQLILDIDALIKEKYSSKLDMVLSQLDRVISMLFHTKAVLTTEEAAMYLGVTTGHLYRLVKRYGIPYNRPSNGKLYFRKDDLDKWLESTNTSEENTTAV